MSAQPTLQRDVDLREQVERLRQALEGKTLDYDNLHAQFLGVMREKRALERELAKLDRKHVPTREVEEVFEHWMFRCGKNPKRVSLDEKRTRMIRAALKLKGLDYCKQAIDGLASRPYVARGGRTSNPAAPDAKRLDDLKYALRGAEELERCFAYAEAPEEEPRSARVPPGRPRVGPRCALDLADHLEHVCGLEVRQAAGYGATRFMAQCPAHEDRSPSLSIAELNDGRILLNCFAGCDTQDILSAIGWEFGHLMGGDPGNTTAAREAQYAGRLA